MKHVKKEGDMNKKIYYFAKCTNRIPRDSNRAESLE